MDSLQERFRLIEGANVPEGDKREVEKRRQLTTLLDVSFAAAAAVSALLAMYLNIPRVPAAKPASSDQLEVQSGYFPSAYFNRPDEIRQPGLPAANSTAMAADEAAARRRVSH